MKPTEVQFSDTSQVGNLTLSNCNTPTAPGMGPVVRVRQITGTFSEHDAATLHSVMRMVLFDAKSVTTAVGTYYITSRTVQLSQMDKKGNWESVASTAYDIQSPRGSIQIGHHNLQPCITALEIMFPEILTDTQDQQQPPPAPVPLVTSAPFPVDFARAQAMHAEFESMDLSWKTAWNGRLGLRTNELEPNAYGLRAIVYDMGSVSTWGVFDDTAQPPRYGHAASFELATINCGTHIIGHVTGLALATEKQLAADAPKSGK